MVDSCFVLFRVKLGFVTSPIQAGGSRNYRFHTTTCDEPIVEECFSRGKRIDVKLIPSLFSQESFINWARKINSNTHICIWNSMGHVIFSMHFVQSCSQECHFACKLVWELWIPGKIEPTFYILSGKWSQRENPVFAFLLNVQVLEKQM